jgi:hypothetical protein
MAASYFSYWYVNEGRREREMEEGGRREVEGGGGS